MIRAIGWTAAFLFFDRERGVRRPRPTIGAMLAAGLLLIGIHAWLATDWMGQAGLSVHGRTTVGASGPRPPHIQSIDLVPGRRSIGEVSE